MLSGLIGRSSVAFYPSGSTKRKALFTNLTRKPRSAHHSQRPTHAGREHPRHTGLGAYFAGDIRRRHIFIRILDVWICWPRAVRNMVPSFY